MITPMIIPRTVSSARFCSFPFTRAEDSGKSPNRSRLRHLTRWSEIHRFDDAVFFLTATFKKTHISTDQSIPFDEIFHLIIRFTFAAGEPELEISGPLTGNAHRLQKWIGKIDKRLLWERDPSAGRFHGDSRNHRARRVCRPKKFAQSFFRRIRINFYFKRAAF